MRHQMNFYLNDDNIIDAFIILELKKERNISGLVKSLLWTYYKEVKPYGILKESQSNESEVTNYGT